MSEDSYEIARRTMALCDVRKPPANPRLQSVLENIDGMGAKLRKRKAEFDVDLRARDFETILTATEEVQFKAWKKVYAPNDSGEDYDLRGAFKAGLRPGPNGHWSDRYKKPNHPTFSVESIYASAAPERAGRWIGDKFIPPAPATVRS